LRAVDEDFGGLFADDKPVLLPGVVPLDHPTLAPCVRHQDLATGAAGGNFSMGRGTLMLFFYCPQKANPTPFTIQRFIAQSFFFAYAMDHYCLFFLTFSSFENPRI
jgi:hypothetical protein